MEKNKCPLCGGAANLVAKSIDGYRRGSYFDILECSLCGVKYSDPLEVDHALYDAIYSNVENVPGYSGYFELAKAIESSLNPLSLMVQSDACYFGVVKGIQDFQSESKDCKIVEIGCGQGYLTHALNCAGFNAIGIDISETAIGLAKKRFGDHYYHGSIESYVRDATQKPSIIICTELIEHLPDPVELIKTALDNLPSGGRLILSTPHKNVGEVSIWDTELPPIHLWWFTRTSLKMLGERLGVSVQFVDLTDYYNAHPSYVLSPQVPKLLRGSFFDESYQLLVRVKRRGLLRSKLREFEKWLKKFITPLIPVSRRKERFRCTDENSVSLCAVFIKK